jgi:hypothetical protein
MNNLTLLNKNLKEWKQKYRQQWRSIWQGLKYAGDQYTCPCCGGNFREFLPYGSVTIRLNALCPKGRPFNLSLL